MENISRERSLKSLNSLCLINCIVSNRMLRFEVCGACTPGSRVVTSEASSMAAHHCQTLWNWLLSLCAQLCSALTPVVCPAALCCSYSCNTSWLLHSSGVVTGRQSVEVGGTDSCH